MGDWKGCHAKCCPWVENLCGAMAWTVGTIGRWSSSFCSLSLIKGLPVKYERLSEDILSTRSHTTSVQWYGFLWWAKKLNLFCGTVSITLQCKQMYENSLRVGGLNSGVASIYLSDWGSNPENDQNCVEYKPQKVRRVILCIVFSPWLFQLAFALRVYLQVIHLMRGCSLQ